MNGHGSGRAAALVLLILCAHPSSAQVVTQFGWSSLDGVTVGQTLRRGDYRFMIVSRSVGETELRATGAWNAYFFRLYPGLGLVLDNDSFSPRQVVVTIADNHKPFGNIFMDGRTALRLGRGYYVRRDIDLFGQASTRPGGCYAGQTFTFIISDEKIVYRGGQMAMLPLGTWGRLRLAVGSMNTGTRQPGFVRRKWDLQWTAWADISTRLDRLR